MLHVIAPTVSPDVAIHGAFIPRDSDVEQQIIEKAVRHMKDTGEGLCGLDRLTCHAEVSTTWPRICSYAEEHDIDLIVLATHGLTGLKHVLIGSVAERVVQHAKCPVLVVK
jgi:nucleotide-binding universal stress UspA family protein